MATQVRMQAKSSADGAIHCWNSDSADWLGVDYDGPGTPSDITLYSRSVDNSSVPVPPFACVTTSPGAGATLTQGTPFTVTGTINRAVSSVAVSLGATALGFATIVGLTWSISGTATGFDLGTKTIAALATALVGGATVSAPGVSVTVASSYVFLDDPKLISVFEPDTGLTDQATHGAWGNLTTVGAAVPITGSFDGRPAYQIRAKAATTGYLKTATLTHFFQPVHVTMIARAAGSPAAGDGWIASGSAVGAGAIRYSSSSVIGMYGGATLSMAATAANFNVIECYFHSNYSYYSVNGGAWTRGNTTVNGDWGGLVLGVMTGATSPADLDVLGIYVYEGDMYSYPGVNPAQAHDAMWSRILARFPTVLAGLTAAAAFSLDTDAPTLWDHTQPWDAFITPFCQSNVSEYSTDNATVAWGASSFLLTNANVWSAGGDPAVAFQWDSFANQTDVVSIDGSTGRGSIAGKIANDMHTASGRPTIGVPCPLGSSAIVPGAAADAQHDWGRETGRGNHVRNCLWWSSVFRAKQVIKWGGTIRKIVCYQGETEALNASSSIRAAWPAQMHANIRQWCADVGIPNPYDHPSDTTCKTVIVRIAGNANTGWTDMRTNVIPTIPLNAQQVMVDAPVAGPFEADGLHLRSAAQDICGGLIAAA